MAYQEPRDFLHHHCSWEQPIQESIYTTT